MRKLLAILGSLTIGVSAAAGVVACGTQSTTPVIEETDDAKQLRYKSLDSVKSLILRNELGLDKKETDSAIDELGGFKNKTSDNFNNLSTNMVNLNNLDGTLGEKSAPIHNLWNEIAKTFKVKDTDKDIVNNYISMFSDSIPKVLDLIIKNGDNANGLVGLIQYALQSLNQLIPDVPLGVETIDTLSQALKYLQYFDLNSTIAKMIGDQKELPLNKIMKMGVDALDRLLNKVLFFDSKDDNANDGDARFSMFLGQEVLTPLLNGGQVNKDAIIKKLETNAGTHAVETLRAASQVLASFGLLMSIYIPKLVDTPKDADHLFGDDTNEKVFGETDNMTVKVDDTDSFNILIGDTKNPISLNSLLWGTMNLVSNEDPNSLGIIKLTNILFHDQFDMSGKSTGNNLLLEKLILLIVDALKFTDYEVNVQKHVEVPVLKAIDIDIKFKLEDLFKPDQHIHITNALGMELYIGTTGYGLLGDLVKNDKGIFEYDLNYIRSRIIPLLKMILFDAKINSTTLKQPFLDALGKKGDSFAIYGDSKSGTKNPLGENFLIKMGWGMGIAPQIVPIVNRLIYNLWYTDAKALLDKFNVDANDPIRNKFPLSKTIYDALSNIVLDSDNGFSLNLIDMSKYLNFDFIMKIIRTLVVENIEPSQELASTKEPDKGKAHDSLLAQIVLAIAQKDPTDPEQVEYLKYTKEHLNQYLGYVDSKDLSSATDGDKGAKDPNSIYVYEDGFIGSIIQTLYGESSHYNDNFIKVGDNKAIALRSQDGSDSKTLNTVLSGLQELYKSLEGIDLKPILKPLINVYDSRIWNMSNIKVSNLEDGNLQGEVYEVTFDSSSVANKDIPNKKAKYRITFLRHNTVESYSVTYIEKIN